MIIWLVVDLPWKMMEWKSVGMMKFPIDGKSFKISWFQSPANPPTSYTLENISPSDGMMGTSPPLMDTASFCLQASRGSTWRPQIIGEEKPLWFTRQDGTEGRCHAKSSRVIMCLGILGKGKVQKLVAPFPILMYCPWYSCRLYSLYPMISHSTSFYNYDQLCPKISRYIPSCCFGATLEPFLEDWSYSWYHSIPHSIPIVAASLGTVKRKHPARKGTLERSMLDVAHPGGKCLWETARIQ